MKIEKFKYTKTDDDLFISEYAPDMNLGIYSDRFETRDRFENLRKYGYFNIDDYLIIDMDHDFSNNLTSIAENLPKMKELMRDYKINELIN